MIKDYGLANYYKNRQDTPTGIRNNLQGSYTPQNGGHSSPKYPTSHNYTPSPISSKYNAFTDTPTGRRSQTGRNSPGNLNYNYRAATRGSDSRKYIEIPKTSGANLQIDTN